MEIVRRWQEDGIPEKLYPLTRQTLWTGHPVSLLRWLKEHEPERYAQIGCVMMTHDYLRWCLTCICLSGKSGVELRHRRSARRVRRRAFRLKKCPVVKSNRASL